MPNWTEQQLHVVGKKAEIDRFMRVGYTPKRKGDLDAVLHLDALCTTPSRDDRGCEITEGAVLTHWRTNGQACFDFITAWDYPAWFYEQLATEWPALSFCCTVAGEMGDFGGLLTCLDGELVDQVLEFDHEYDRRGHLRAARKTLTRWMAFLTRERDWRVEPHRAWDIGYLRGDAHFDGNFWFYFRSREDMATFRARYRCHSPQRRDHGEWKRTR